MQPVREFLPRPLFWPLRIDGARDTNRSNRIKLRNQGPPESGQLIQSATETIFRGKTIQVKAHKLDPFRRMRRWSRGLAAAKSIHLQKAARLPGAELVRWRQTGLTNRSG